MENKKATNIVCRKCSGQIVPVKKLNGTLWHCRKCNSSTFMPCRYSDSEEKK